MNLPFGESAEKIKSERAGARVFLAWLSLTLAAGVFAPSHGAKAVTCGFGSPIGGGQCQGFITSTTTPTWTVPSDWNNSSNTIEVIGAGGSSAFSAVQLYGGGGGGAYAKISNLSLTSGASINIAVGTGQPAQLGNGVEASSTWFNATSCSAASVCGAGGYNTAGGLGASGGTVAGSRGDVINAGGTGGTDLTAPGAGGGGAGGPNGAGAMGGTGGDNTGWGGGGGGGNGGGGRGAPAASGYRRQWGEKF